jgi:hypothetical protein
LRAELALGDMTTPHRAINPPPRLPTSDWRMSFRSPLLTSIPHHRQARPAIRSLLSTARLLSSSQLHTPKMSVPNVKLNDGTSMPIIGFGTGESESPRRCSVPNVTPPDHTMISLLALLALLALPKLLLTCACALRHRPLRPRVLRHGPRSAQERVPIPRHGAAVPQRRICRRGDQAMGREEGGCVHPDQVCVAGSHVHSIRFLPLHTNSRTAGCAQPWGLH